MCFKIFKRVLLKWKTLKFRHSKPVIINLLHILPLYQTKLPDLPAIYSMVLLYLKDTKLTNSYSLKWFMKINIGCNFWLSKFTPWKIKFTPRVNLPQVKNHCSKQNSTKSISKWKRERDPTIVLLQLFACWPQGFTWELFTNFVGLPCLTRFKQTVLFQWNWCMVTHERNRLGLLKISCSNFKLRLVNFYWTVNFVQYI